MFRLAAPAAEHVTAGIDDVPMTEDPGVPGVPEVVVKPLPA